MGGAAHIDRDVVGHPRDERGDRRVVAAAVYESEQRSAGEVHRDAAGDG